MIAIAKSLIENKKINVGVKGVVCLLIIVWFFNSFFINGIDAYVSYKDYYYRNEISDNSSAAVADCVEQHFVAKGNNLSNIDLYLGGLSDTDISIEIVDSNEKVLSQTSFNPTEYIANAWNKIAIDAGNLKRDGKYFISFKGSDLSSLILTPTNSFSKIFTSCSVDGSETSYTLAIGMQLTYKYVMLGYGLELAVRLMFIIAIAGCLCFTIYNIDKIYYSFKCADKKKGFWYAVYFSIYTTLLFNPLGTIRTEVIEFSRVMGAGLNAGVDVSRRISNFNHWFIYLAVGFVLFFLLANYLKHKELSDENKKAVELLDNVIVVANVVLLLRCITYFYNESQAKQAFYYSDFFIMLVMLLIGAYILLNLQSKISVERLETILVCGWMIVLPASIVITHDWTLGRVFMGFQVLMSLAILLFVKFINIEWNENWIESGLDTCAVFLSLIPFCTSLYIEFVTILNQHEIFLSGLRRNYFCSICIGLIITVGIAALLIEKNKSIREWKKFSYPAIILGFSCLWKQIAVTATYNADIFETANSSILISDFLNFGDIPIVQHYGGHMMSGVWEGIIYGLLNNDSMGANFSPYSEYIAVVIAIVFYLLVKYIWDEDAAVLVTLFFPFYNSISYFGLGILMALAAMAYVRKNTYLRAALFWFAFIWCAIYRLDLGYAFAVACILALLIYVFREKNLVAVKQLGITLGCWIVAGLATWFGICFVKDINPVNRLFEFLYINLSNQNWAYSNIGDVSQTKYAVTYMLIPFICIVMLIYTVFERKVRENVGAGQWVLLLVLGLSYFFNFSRGLVRHSLAENALNICWWSALVFISVFVATVRNNKKMFLPVFCGCVLMYTLFLSGYNFTEISIADAATRKIGNYTETWTLDRFAEEETPDDEIANTYWQKLKDNGEVIERVEWNKDLRCTVEDYRIVIDCLLEDDETFVDLINKTSIYPLLSRENPVYVSQSPLQLSGQFTQEEFVKEMESVPIILMPYDPDNNRASESLDGVPNSYRYYKVFEYVYQNYVPLCTYENLYAVWCLPNRYEEMSTEVEKLSNSGVDITQSLASAKNIARRSVETISNADGSISMNFTGTDPMLVDLQNIMDLSEYEDKNVTLAIEYETDVLGVMQIFYTTDANENYTANKVVSVELTKNKGKAYFKIPVTKYTRIRLDTPEGSNVKIKSFKLGACNCKIVDYGYDGPYLAGDGVNYSYLPSIHNYSLGLLPVIWAEGDTENSADNSVTTVLTKDGNIYKLDIGTTEYGSTGNYLKVSMDYYGLDQLGKTDDDDETTTATIKLGKKTNNKFETLYIYSFTVKEGQHDYMFRISNDYYWYLGDVNAVVIESGSQLNDVKMSVLEGD